MSLSDKNNPASFQDSSFNIYVYNSTESISGYYISEQELFYKKLKRLNFNYDIQVTIKSISVYGLVTLSLNDTVLVPQNISFLY